MAGLTSGLVGGAAMAGAMGQAAGLTLPRGKRRKPGDPGLLAGGIAALPGFFGNPAKPAAPAGEGTTPTVGGTEQTTQTGTPVKRKRRGVLDSIRTATGKAASILGTAPVQGGA